jgi:hypothetical protein
MVVGMIWIILSAFVGRLAYEKGLDGGFVLNRDTITRIRRRGLFGTIEKYHLHFSGFSRRDDAQMSSRATETKFISSKLPSQHQSHVIRDIIHEKPWT